METREIPKAEWQVALDRFSRGHHGQAAKIATAGAIEKSMRQADGLPLFGATVEQNGGKGPLIEIIAGDPTGVHVSHTVSCPTHVRVAEWNDGVSGLLEIESEDGTTASVQVGPTEQTLPPGMITDGLYERK
jgi:hypothetical protein